MKSKIFYFFMLFVLVVGITGCGGSDTADTTTDDSGKEVTAESDKTVIKFAVQADNTDALDTIVSAFNEQSDQYLVEAIVLTNDSGNMHDQIINSLSSQSSEYDVLSMDVVWAGEFAAAGYLEPLDTFIKDNGWSVEDFNAGSMASGKYKGKNYVLPYFSDLGFVYFRSDIVSEEEQTMLENGDYTMNDLLSLAEKYAGEGDTKYGYVYQSKQYEGLTCNANEFTDNWQDVEGGLELMKQFTDSTATPDDILVYTEGETHNAFLNGESVFARNWPYMNGMAASGEYAITTDQIGFAPLPNGGTVGGWILGVSAYSENMDGAKEFIKFLAGPEGQKINATIGGYMPGYNALLTDAEVLESNILLNSVGFTNALQSTIARPVVSNYSEVSDAIQVNAHEYLSGNGELADAVSAITEALGQ